MIVATLLDAGADHNARTIHTRHNLCTACRFGNEKIVELLVSKDANLDVKRKGQHCDSCQSASPLYEAASNGHTSVNRSLLQNGASPNFPVDQKVSPMQLAAHEGHKDAV